MAAKNVDWLEVNVKRSNLADAMGFSRAGLGDDAVVFFDKFKRSGFMARFERGDGRATLGCSGCELVLMIHDRLGIHYQSADFKEKCTFSTISAPIEYWIGYALGYIQGRSGMAFNEIFGYFPLESWYKMYSLHEVGDEALWDKTIGRYAMCCAPTKGEYKFGGRDHPFSNYYPAQATFEGMVFATGEGAFQAAKTLDMGNRCMFTDIDPGNAKGLGRKLELRDDWEVVKHGVMLDILRSKFADPALRQMLLDTGEQKVVEDTTGWHDNIWGNCECPNCAHIEGGNLLGKALMKLRAEFRSPALGSVDK